MAQDTRSHVRFNAIMCIGKNALVDFKLRLIRQGLLDKSSKVRMKAADWGSRMRLQEILPDLERALTVESNAKARTSFAWYIDFLRNNS